MRSVIEELRDFVHSDKGLATYYERDDIPSGTGWRTTLTDFLLSTMDEIRLRHAGEACREALQRFDVEDADYFRMAVLRREVTRDIAYPRQRDHSAHTVNNWLLGWYLVSHSEPLKAELERHFTLRKLQAGKYTFPEVFGDVFTFASLLHDVGYMFEGALRPFDSDASVRQASSGMGVVQDYFNYRFWRENRISSTADRMWLQEMIQMDSVGPRPASTLSGIADSLRYIGQTEKLRQAVLAELKVLKIAPPECIVRANALIPDAFQLWKFHYETFSPAVSELIDVAEAVFYSHIEKGIDGAGLRVLDHAMCSGLLLLQYSSLYYQVYHGLGDSAPADPAHYKIWARFRRDGEGFEYPALFWWNGVLWSTAATALHNILQISPRDWPINIKKPQPLALKHDPLTYLGILVDCLQEWDRYTVQRNSIFGGTLPVQGVDVGMEAAGGKIVLSFKKTSGRARKVREALDDALADWRSIVDVIET
jgi:hypothetical protein